MHKKISSLPKPLVIFICGMPGTRKSSTAIQLAAKLGVKIVLGTDQVRDILKLYIDNPFIKRPTHNSWELIGARTPENIVKGYLRQSALVKKAVMEALELAKKRGENMIFEGAHLCPELYSELKTDSDLVFFHFLLWVTDETLHHQNIALKIRLRHQREKDWPKEKIEDIREIQRFLLESPVPHIHFIDSTSPQKNVMKILKILEESL